MELGFGCTGAEPSTCSSTCGDGIKASDEACDDAAPAEDGDGCSAACTLESGYLCLGGQPTSCTAACGTPFDLNAGPQDWIVLGGGLSGGFEHGTNNALVEIGFETGLNVGLPVADVVDTAIQRLVAVPDAGAPKPELAIEYALDGEGSPTDCMRVYVGETPAMLSGDLVVTECDDTAGALETLTVDLAGAAGAARWISIRFVRDGGGLDPAGLFINSVSVRSDVDADGTGEHGAMAGCDFCIDVDDDGYGRSDSVGLSTCNAGAEVDCNDDPGDGGAAVFPSAIEDCSTAVDEDCDGEATLGDPQCFEDCANGIDDGGEGGNTLVDCDDAFCATDAFCSPCSIDYTFTHGGGDWTAEPLWSHVVAGPDGFWKTGGAAGLDPGKISGKLEIQVDVPTVADGGPRPTLEVAYLLEGQANPAFDVLVICVDNPTCKVNSGFDYRTGKNTAANVPPLDGGPADFNDGVFDHVFLDLTPKAGSQITVTLLFDSVNTSLVAREGLSVTQVRVASDVDVDGEPEGSAPGCDQCWDEDGDGYVHLLSPGLNAGCTNPGQPDCDDAVGTTNPGAAEDCDAPGDENCNGLANTDDLDACGSEDCANFVDDNSDNLPDCADPQCASDPACDVCGQHFNFVRGGSGWAPSDQDPNGDGATTSVFQHGISATHASAVGWSTVLDGDVSSANTTGAGAVRAWLSRTVVVPAGAPEPALEIRYSLQGDAVAGKDVFGVCFGVAASQCGPNTPANFKVFETSTASSPAELDVVVLPVSPGQVQGGTLDVVIFYDTVDDQQNDNPGLFVGDVLVRSDIDGDAQYENTDASCDHCVDADGDGYGSEAVAADFIATCAQSAVETDCDDADEDTKPGIAENCAVVGDQNCNDLADAQEEACSVCGDNVVTAGEQCDDGVDGGSGLPVGGDGCDATCYVEAGALHLTELHLTGLGGLGEQWLELYNSSDSPVDLQQLGLAFEKQNGAVQVFADECEPLAGKSSSVAAGAFYVIALGDITTSDGLDADAECSGAFQFLPADTTLRLLAGSTTLDEVVYGGFSCELAQDLKGGQSRSLELDDPTAKDASSNDSASAWCLSGPKSGYGNSGSHFGSPGAPSECGEVACDGEDDDCDGPIDENDWLPGGDPEYATWDTDGDGICDDQDCPGDTCLGQAACVLDVVANNPLQCAVHANDLDHDCIPDCKDTCLDGDGDGWGSPGGLLPHTCNTLGDGSDATDCNDDLAFVFPQADEALAIGGACTNGVDDDCDGQPDCLDAACSGQPSCGQETCAGAVEIACGEALTIDPVTNAFPCGEGEDAFLKFVPTITETVQIQVTNEAQKQYGVSVLTAQCDEAAACDPILGTALGVPTVVPQCLQTGSGTAAVTAGTEYFLIVDQVDDCGVSGTTAATVVVVCGEVCASSDDEDGDGLVGCADPDCVPDAACAAEDFDLDGVPNGDEITCGSDPENVISIPPTDDLLNPDKDALINCVDPDDDNDGFSDAEEAVLCLLNPGLAKNESTIHPGHALFCDGAGVDADCNLQFDTTEAACGAKEDKCADGEDGDNDGLTDCDDPDCVPDNLCASADFDSDGVPNGVEIACNFDPIDGNELPGPTLASDIDDDGLPNCTDTDDDGDGFDDVTEQVCGSLPSDASSLPPNDDGDGQCDAVDKDDDNDGFEDGPELNCASDPKDAASTPEDPAHDLDQDGVCDLLDPDIDGDSWTNGLEEACGTNLLDPTHNPTTLSLDIDGDKICDALDSDDDGDTWSDDKESLCGTDKNDPTSVPTDLDGDGKCDVLDKDADEDQWPDVTEIACDTDPLDPASNPTALGTDQDDDQLCDKIDDNDDGGDWSDATELQCGTDPLDPASEPTDTDGDSLCDPQDADDDGDSWLDVTEEQCDTDPLDAADMPADGDGDGQCDVLDPDADPDGDSWLNKDEDNCGTDGLDAQDVPKDTDQDSVCDVLDLDDDEDGWGDLDEIACESEPLLSGLYPVDTDGDGTCDFLDTDDDGDGVPDAEEVLCGTNPLDASELPLEIDIVDTDLDGAANCVDDDDDDDTVLDTDEAEIGSDPLLKDTDEDGLEDGVENADQDGVVGPTETDPTDADSDDDGLDDGQEAAGCYLLDAADLCLTTEGWDADSDDDGIKDGLEDKNGDGETQPGETNPLVADTDTDGFVDGEEVQCGTDPLDVNDVPVDKDGNGVCDGAEKDSDDDGIADVVEDYCGTDPFDNSDTPSFSDLVDIDGDGALNCADDDDDGDDIDDVVEEECQTDPRDAADKPTTDQLLDTDGDGALNCSDTDDDDDGLTDDEEAELGTEPLDNDSDDDGVSDGKEVNIWATDPSNADTDGDGVDDGIELGFVEGTSGSEGFPGDQDPTTVTDPKNPDTDDDGVLDGEEDANGNGRVDEGEGDPLSALDGLNDEDGDGLTDRDELLVYETDPKDPDSDHDFLNDKLEVSVHFTDPNDPDSDDGGVMDGIEIENGTDPKDRLDDFSTAVVIGDNVFGCRAGGEAPSATGLALLLIVALGWLAARRRRAAGIAAALVALLGLGLAPGPAQAQIADVRASGNVNLENFWPQGGRYRVWSVEESQVGPKWQPYASILFHGERESVRVVAGRHEERLVSSAYWADLNLGIGLFDWIQVEVGLPVALAMESDVTTESIAPIEGAGLGDMIVRIRSALLKNQVGGFGIGASVGLTLPTGSGEHFRGDEGVGVTINTIWDYKTQRVVLSLNVGFRLRTVESVFLNENFGHELTYGLGLDVQVLADQVHIATEVFGHTPLTDPFQEISRSSLEVMFGPKWWIIPSLSLQAAIGAGLVQGYGTPDFRFVTGLQWAPRTDDTDGDGIDDRTDLCPLSPEDKDGYSDQDGCPEPDNDNDGVLDSDDKCPNESEDLNGIADDDGCPDGDADGDGVPDAVDECPQQPEDRDNWEDANGCPDPDNDNDGFLDGDDTCPNRPETVNNFQDDDGCDDIAPPVGGPQLPERDPLCDVAIPGRILFYKGRSEISQAGMRTIRAVAELMRNNPMVVRVIVEGHASEEGSDEANLALSRRRAAEVRSILQGEGASAGRLGMRGFGEAKPRVDQSTEAAYRENRRVEFHVVLTDRCVEQTLE